MNKNLNLQMEVLEDVAAPSNAGDFTLGVLAGLGGVAAVVTIVAFT